MSTVTPIRCTSCRHENDPWRRHCGACGTALPGACAKCGFVNRDSDRFCGGCSAATRVTPEKALPMIPRLRVPPRPPPALRHDRTMPIERLEGLVISEAPLPESDWLGVAVIIDAEV
jgi:hypothetical protein